MNIKREQGFSTLLITVVISLIMALYVFSLLSVELFNSKKNTKHNNFARTKVDVSQWITMRG